TRCSPRVKRSSTRVSTGRYTARSDQVLVTGDGLHYAVDDGSGIPAPRRPGRTVTTMASRATKRWMLGMAAAFALLGLVLKLSDLRGREDPQRRAGEPVSVHPGEGAAALARDLDVSSSPTDVASAGDDRGGIGRHAEPGTAAVPRPSIGQDATELR